MKTIVLSDIEVRIVTEALEGYRLRKGAEGKLTSHKEKTPDAIKTVQARYDVLNRHVVKLQKRLIECSEAHQEGSQTS